jgi:putative heme-binding domain-containing protein
LRTFRIPLPKLTKLYFMTKQPLLIALLCVFTCLASHAQEFQSLFNGKDLTGWAGKTQFWSVKDGAILGETTADNPLEAHTFLVWEDGEVGDFVFKATVRFAGNNSGVQYRSRLFNRTEFTVKGYQADLHPRPDYFGMLFGRGIIARRFQRVEVGANGKPKVVGKVGDKNQELVGSEWNDLTIIAVGDRLIHQVNGINTVDVTDNHPAAKRKGILAFQLHVGAPMTIEIKDIQLRHLSGKDAAATIKTAIENRKKAPASAPKKKVALAPRKFDGAKWIWHAKPANTAASHMKKTFEVKGGAKEALLVVSCDNGARIYLNGKHVVTNANWKRPSSVDVTRHLKSGPNELRAEATNDVPGNGAFIASLVFKDNAGREVKIQSDASWEAAAPETDEWKAAVVLANYGDKPWGTVFKGQTSTTKAVPRVALDETITGNEIFVPEGFEVTRLYNVPRDKQGSWVGLTIDHQGRLIACDQYGAMYRMTLPPVGSRETLQPQKIEVDLPGAHGVLAAFDSLYVMVNDDKSRNGLYRVTDSDGDDQYDAVEFVHRIQGGGEHGIHSMAVSPNGKRLFFNCGNSAALPEIDGTRAPKLWSEDHVLPRLWDGRRGKTAKVETAAGYICSMNPDGSDLELFCHGFRNQFDIAFDLGGQLFTYDADMELDIGTPWYRFTRVNHCVSGADFGWRAGAGKFPDYYPDNLPTTIDIGPGSPTGVVSGNAAKFPERYQRALFINDWTYGTMWAVHLTPNGASYSAVKEDFLHGKPLPLTDVVISPRDGAMYFAVGGRKLQSGVYRVTYIGDESTTPVKALPVGRDFELRAELETFHVDGADPKTVLAKAWPQLDHGDRHIRFAARVAIERLPVDSWQKKAMSETRTNALIEAVIALTRVSGRAKVLPSDEWQHDRTSSPPIAAVTAADEDLQNQLWKSLAQLDFAQLSTDQQLAALRAYQLAYTRLGKPSPETCRGLAARLEAVFPADDPFVNRELCQMLVALDSRTVVSQALALMATAADSFDIMASDAVLSRSDTKSQALRRAASSRPNTQQIAYLVAVRNATAGWTPETRKTYFSWFPRVRSWQGGNSYKGFMEAALAEAIANIAPQGEVAELQALSAAAPSAPAGIVPPKGPGKTYALDETVRLAKKSKLRGRDFSNGRNMYRALCAICHPFGGDGGSIGPDLTGSGNRYTIRDLMENIIDPSAVISDQFGTHQITRKDGNMVIGRILTDEDGKVTVMTNPFAPRQQLTIAATDIAKTEERKVSMMPAGLINALNEQELLDLIAYLLSGGDPKNGMFDQ